TPALLVTYKFIGVNDAGDATGIAGLAPGSRIVGTHHPTPALNDDVVLGSGHLRRQGDFKLDRCADFHGGFGTDINTGGAEIAGYTLGLAGRIGFMNFDRQL